MVATAPAVVIGGGIVGSSIAHYLAQKGLRGVVLLEQDTIACGATGNSGALVRMHYANPWDAALALKSLEVFAHWDDLIGGDIGFHNTGFIMVVGRHDGEKLLKNVTMLQGVGVNTRAISPEELTQLQPFCAVQDIDVAAYEPDSGYADGYSTGTAMARQARELGVQVRQGVKALGIRRYGDRVAGVETSEGEIQTPVVVLAAGAWSAALARTAGIDLPMTARRLSAGVLERPPELHQPHMTYIDRGLSTYFRPDVGDLTLVGIRSPRPDEHLEVDPDNYDATVAIEWRAHVVRQLTHRVPSMMDALWRMEWASVDGHTPDGHMILDRAPGVEGLYVAAGMSGTGFKTGPAVGMVMAELVLEGQARTADIRPFRLSRFQEGEPFPEEDEYLATPFAFSTDSHDDGR